MSKKSKAKSKEKRISEKRKRKAAQAALYASYRDAGQNTKSFRARKAAKASRGPRVRHASGPCRNVGCDRCFPKPIRLGTWPHLTARAG